MPVDAPVTKTASLAMRLSLVNDHGVAFGIWPKSHQTVRRFNDVAQLDAAAAQLGGFRADAVDGEHYKAALALVGHHPHTERGPVGELELGPTPILVDISRRQA